MEILDVDLLAFESGSGAARRAVVDGDSFTSNTTYRSN